MTLIRNHFNTVMLSLQRAVEAELARRRGLIRDHFNTVMLSRQAAKHLSIVLLRFFGRFAPSE